MCSSDLYDLLIVDEVSKMLLPEFLAIAIKARRWVLVGDPEQLPPFMDAPECGATLNGIMSPMTELVCSAAAILEKEKEGPRSAFRMIVATNEPGLFVELLKGHLSETGLGGLPSIREDADGWLDGVVACQRENIDDVFERLNPSARSNRGQNPSYVGGIPLLVENGLSVDRPKVAGGLRLVDERCRAGARAMEIGRAHV